MSSSSSDSIFPSPPHFGLPQTGVLLVALLDRLLDLPSRSAWSVAAGALVLKAGFLVAFNLTRRKALAKDSPPSMSRSDLPAVWEAILKEHEARAKAKKAAAAPAAASTAASSSESTAHSSTVDLSTLVFRGPTLADLDTCTAQTIEIASTQASGLDPQFPPAPAQGRLMLFSLRPLFASGVSQRAR